MHTMCALYVKSSNALFEEKTEIQVIIHICIIVVVNHFQCVTAFVLHEGDMRVNKY